MRSNTSASPLRLRWLRELMRNVRIASLMSVGSFARDIIALSLKKSQSRAHG